MKHYNIFPNRTPENPSKSSDTNCKFRTQSLMSLMIEAGRQENKYYLQLSTPISIFSFPYSLPLLRPFFSFYSSHHRQYIFQLPLGYRGLETTTQLRESVMVKSPNSEAFSYPTQYVYFSLPTFFYSYIPQMYSWWRPSTSGYTQKNPKKLRFAYRNLFYSPRQTVSVFAISSYPNTPPSIGYGLSGPSLYVVSYASIDPQMSSAPYAGHIYAHPMLDSSSIIYDLIEHPSTILMHNGYSLSVRTFREPATTPPLPFLTITTIPPLHRKVIVFRVSATKNMTFPMC